jgi:hypothetical protein
MPKDRRELVATLLTDREYLGVLKALHPDVQRWKQEQLANLRRDGYDPVGAAVEYRGYADGYHRWEMTAELRKRIRPPV